MFEFLLLPNICGDNVAEGALDGEYERGVLYGVCVFRDAGGQAGQAQVDGPRDHGGDSSGWDRYRSQCERVEVYRA